MLLWKQIDQESLITDFIDEISVPIWEEDIAGIEKLRSHISLKNYIFVLFKEPYDVIRNALNCDDSSIMLVIVKDLTLDEKKELFKLVVANAHVSIFRKHAQAIKSLLYSPDDPWPWLELLQVKMKNGKTPVEYATYQEDDSSLKVFNSALVYSNIQQASCSFSLDDTKKELHEFVVSNSVKK